MSLIFLRFYESEHSIVGDPELGPILSSLMVGPCALEFTRLNSDTFWFVSSFFLVNSDNFCFRSDPSAGELVQRHRLTSIERDKNCWLNYVNHLEFPAFPTLILQLEVL